MEQRQSNHHHHHHHHHHLSNQPSSSYRTTRTRNTEKITSIRPLAHKATHGAGRSDSGVSHITNNNNNQQQQQQHHRQGSNTYCKASSGSHSKQTARTVNIEQDELLLCLEDTNGNQYYNFNTEIHQNNNNNNNNNNINNDNSIYHQEIDCTKSAASVSTMTKTHHSSANTSTRSPPHIHQHFQPDTRLNNHYNNTDSIDQHRSQQPQQQQQRKRNAPSSTNNSCSHSLGSGLGITRALSKLALCGHSARESSLNLEYLVLSLRQALTGDEAAKSLRDMVHVLKDAHTGQRPNHHHHHNNHNINRSTAELQHEFIAAGADHCVISTLWNFPSHLAVQYYGIVTLGELVAHAHTQTATTSTSKNNNSNDNANNLAHQKSIVIKGGIEVVLTAMKTHAMEEAIQEEACRTLKNITKYFDDAKLQVARHKGIARVLQAMMTHPEYATVQRQACYALTSLSCLKSISDEMVVKQGHAVLIKTMQHHNDDPFVLAEAWRTLTNMIIHAMDTTLDEEIAAHALDLILQALDKFADCTLVPIQARGLTLLTHLCYRSASNLDRVTMTDNLETIYRILRLWKYDEKVQVAGTKLVQQISHAGFPTALESSSLSLSSDYNHTNTNGARGRGRTRAQRRNRGDSSSRGSGRFGRPLKTAVIGQIQNDSGMDVIVDTTYF